MRWRMITISTKRSWLPGDQRGFRNRQHRIHSSGDYKNPPPRWEHEGLRRYNEKRCDIVELPDDVAKIKRIVGNCKMVSSKDVSYAMSGNIWAEGCDYDPIDDDEHLENAVIYVYTKQGPGAWVWRPEDGNPQAGPKCNLGPDSAGDDEDVGF
jgi:hypothetical protein